MSLTPFEQETIILFNEQDQIADVQTYNSTLKRELSALCESHPEKVEHVRSYEQGGMYFTVPKAWINIKAPRKISESDHARYSELGERLYNQFCEYMSRQQQGKRSGV